MNSLYLYLTDSFRFFIINFWKILLIFSPVVIPVEIVDLMIWGSPGNNQNPKIFLYLIELLLRPICQGALILFLYAKICDDAIDIQEFFKKSLKKWSVLIRLSILNGLVVFGGLFLLIIPGFIFMARVSFSEFYCVLEGNKKAIDAFSKSWSSTKLHQWIIFSGILLIIMLSMLFAWGVQNLLVNFGLWNYLFKFITGVIDTVLLSILTIFSYRVFSEIKVNN